MGANEPRRPRATALRAQAGTHQRGARGLDELREGLGLLLHQGGAVVLQQRVQNGVGLCGDTHTHARPEEALADSRAGAVRSARRAARCVPEAPAPRCGSHPRPPRAPLRLRRARGPRAPARAGQPGPSPPAAAPSPHLANERIATGEVQQAARGGHGADALRDAFMRTVHGEGGSARRVRGRNACPPRRRASWRPAWRRSGSRWGSAQARRSAP